MMYTWNDYLLNDLSPQYERLFRVGRGDVCLNALPYEMGTAGLSFHKTFMGGFQSTVIPAGKGGAYSTPTKTLKMIRDLRPNVMATSPSWSITLAEEAARGSFDLRSLGLKKMWLTGEGCSPAFRQRVEKIWGTTANHLYGSLECGALGIECDAHNGYHLTQAHVLMEIVDPRTGESLPPGEIGEIVVTALLRYDSPIIRFRTGDLGYLDTAECACGSTLTRFHMKGRAFDQLHFRGRPLSPFFLEEFLMRMPEVGNWFQFVTPASDSARIKIRCELAEGVQPSAELAATLASRMEASRACHSTSSSSITCRDRLKRINQMLLASGPLPARQRASDDCPRTAASGSVAAEATTAPPPDPRRPASSSRKCPAASRSGGPSSTSSAPMCVGVRTSSIDRSIWSKGLSR